MSRLYGDTGGRGSADEPVPLPTSTPKQLLELVTAARDLAETWPRGTVRTTSPSWQATFDEQHGRLAEALVPFAAFPGEETH